MPITFTSRELATVLAALRYFQQDLIENEEGPISEHFAQETPLSPDEIDELCERLNCDSVPSREERTCD